MPIKEDIKELEKVGGRAGSDTLRLWESYKEQALLWRALFLLQIPATTIAIFSTIIMFMFADTVIEVPEKPQPGYYSVTQLPDSQFIGTAVTLVNNIATYTEQTARDTFANAKKYLWEPALTEFETTMWVDELKVIQETNRSQLFIINEKFINVERHPNQDFVVVRIPGISHKLIGGKSQASQKLQYIITMTTIPKNAYNEYGIVVTNFRVEEIQEGQI